MKLGTSLTGNELIKIGTLPYSCKKTFVLFTLILSPIFVADVDSLFSIILFSFFHNVQQKNCIISIFKICDIMLWIYLYISWVLASDIHYLGYRIVEYCREKHALTDTISYFEGLYRWNAFISLEHRHIPSFQSSPLSIESMTKSMKLIDGLLIFEAIFHYSS